ncbi:VanZ family protein [Streptomyces sp. NPDC020403]|uniref:VanZ family protein n=1 Tax=unclassified Streptomyces TaxID=2593676 RepID=UPI00340E9265
MGRLLLRVAVLTAASAGLVVFSYVLAKVTLTPSPASEDIVTSNLRPGRSLRQYAEQYTFLAACKQAGGNIVLGMPFGVLLPILVPRRLRMIRMTVLTALVMVVVELTQGALVTGRAFDIDDVILNTGGALLGYLLVGRRISHRYHTLSDQPVPEKAAGTPGPDTPEPAAGSGSRAGTRTWRPGGKATAGTGGPAGKTAAARRSTPAPADRGRALVDRWRGRRPGPGGGAPGARP